MLAIWSQIAGAIVFLVLLVWLFNKYMAPAIATYTANKNAEIREQEQRRERMRADVGDAQAELTRADEDVREIRARQDVAQKREREAAVAAARGEAERIVRNAEGELERARLAARDKLRIELIEKALQKARAEAQQRIDDATNVKLVEATVDDLARGNR